MYRLLLLVAVFPFLAAADVGRAFSTGFDYDIVAIDLAGQRTNLTHSTADDLSPIESGRGAAR